MSPFSAQFMYLVATSVLWVTLAGIICVQHKRILRVWGAWVVSVVIWIPTSSELLEASYSAALHPASERAKDGIAYTVTRGMMGLFGLCIVMGAVTLYFAIKHQRTKTSHRESHVTREIKG